MLLPLCGAARQSGDSSCGFCFVAGRARDPPGDKRGHRSGVRHSCRERNPRESATGALCHRANEARLQVDRVAPNAFMDAGGSRMPSPALAAVQLLGRCSAGRRHRPAIGRVPLRTCFPPFPSVVGLTPAEAAGQLPPLFSLTPCNRPIVRIRRSAPARLGSAPAIPPAVAAKCSPLVAPRAASVSPLSDAPQGRLLFGSTRRVRRSADFTAARETGRRIDGGWFLLWVRNRSDDRPTRLGVAASRAVGGAVVRNRCKRILRSLFRCHQHEVPPGLDLIVSARPSMTRADAAEFEKRFLKTLRRLAGEPSVQQ